MIPNSTVYVVAVFLIAAASSVYANDIVNYGSCNTPNGDRGSCINLKQCTFLFNMFSSLPLTPEDQQFLSSSQCGSLDGSPLVCCRDEHIADQQPKTIIRGSVPKPGTCGASVSNRIYGGTTAKIDEFPWTALILYDKGHSIDHHCGGSLISDQYVLTAAHCIRSSTIPETWKVASVRLAEWNTLTDPDCEKDTRNKEVCAHPHVDIPIESTITHPNYVHTSKNQLHDIALLRLSRKVNFTEFIQPICLPVTENLKRISYDGISMDIAGWGLTENGTTSNFKLKAEVPGVPLSGCQRLYSKRGVQLENSQICAGGRMGVDSCCGDSGGALVALDTSDKSRYYFYIAGIISFGPTPCGLHGWPGVYTKVSNYADWIQENIHP